MSSSPPPPPGFQLLFNTNAPTPSPTTTQSPLNPFNYITLPIHWSIIRTPGFNFRLINGPELLSESLPPDWWTEHVKREKTDDGSDGSKYIELYYKDVGPGGEIIKLKLVETVVEQEVAVYVSKGEEDKLDVGLIDVQGYLVANRLGGGDGGRSSLGSVYKIAELWGLEKLVQGIVTGESRLPDPYASKLPADRLKQLQEEKKLRQEETDRQTEQPRSLPPPHNPRIPQYDPLRDIGRSDLDPFGGGGIGGGMLMDPRGFRRPQLPGGIVPGSRYDPIGPPPRPGAGLFGPRGGGGAPRLPFGFPDPDHERMPPGGGYDDMFM